MESSYSHIQKAACLMALVLAASVFSTANRVLANGAKLAPVPSSSAGLNPGFRALPPRSSRLANQHRSGSTLPQRFDKLAQYHQGSTGENNGGGGHGRRHGGGHRGGYGGGGIGIIIDIAPTLLTPQHRHKRRHTHKRQHSHKKVHTHRKKAVRKARTRNNRIIRAASLPKFRPNEVVVLLDGSQPQSVEADLAQTHRLVRLESEDITRLDARILRYRILGRRSPATVIAAMRADPRISLIQENFFYYLRHKPANRNVRGAQKDLQYALTKLGAADAHAMALGRDVLVAVIDSGIDGSHPDLKGAVTERFNAVGDRKSRAHSHGTAIAGIIGARGKLQGMAPQADLLAVRAFYVNKGLAKPQTTSFILLRAISWSLDKGARILNMSFSGPRDELVKRMLNVAHEQGSILVAAAGNGGSNAPPAYPAAYDNVIAITATDQADRLYDSANRGDYLALAAPGVDVMVLARKKRYGFSSGTSLAAAHVSGMIALLLERNPNASAGSIREAIISTAHDLGPKGYDPSFGAGRADAYRALQALERDMAAAQKN